MTHLASTAYHPQTDGQTEVMNKVLEDCLRIYVSADQCNWDRNIAMVEFAINNSVNASTGEAPFFLNYARHPHTPVSLEFPDKPERLPMKEKLKRIQYPWRRQLMNTY